MLEVIKWQVDFSSTDLVIMQPLSSTVVEDRRLEEVEVECFGCFAL